MAERTDDSWPECEREGCIGVQLAASRMCLAHASDKELEAALRVITESGVVDARGVPLSNTILDRVMAAAPRDDAGNAVLNAARFDGATFTGTTTFRGATFTGDAVFSGATFTGDALFERATFTRRAVFRGTAFTGTTVFERATFTGTTVFERATFTRAAVFRGTAFSGSAAFAGVAFSGVAWFSGVTFTGHAWFGDATFSGAARFERATFAGDAVFAGAAFSGVARFERATFRHRAVFRRATFTGGARFDSGTFSGAARFGGGTFSGAARFGGATFRRLAEFEETRFEQSREFGPLLACRGLVLDDALFAQQVQIEVSAPGVCCRRARFPAGVQFRLRWARVVLDDTDIPAPSILTGVPRLSSEGLTAQEERIARAWRRLLKAEVSERPQLLSLRRANVAGLGLSNVMVAGCRFADAHNLDKLRLESGVKFAPTPIPFWGLGRQTWHGRQVIAEECSWRANRSRTHRWKSPPWPHWLHDQQPDALEASQIAGLYRALRKGREDIKDEPGAADFYYGEMEMRRRRDRPVSADNPDGQSSATNRGRVERGIVTAYWLVCGYGLRAWRALACLAAITALFAVAFHLVGFTKPPQPVSYWTSLLYAFRATLSLTDSNVQLTAWGQLLQGLLRLTGPVLLALALLALRGRVKR